MTLVLARGGFGMLELVQANFSSFYFIFNVLNFTLLNGMTLLLLLGKVIFEADDD